MRRPNIPKEIVGVTWLASGVIVALLATVYLGVVVGVCVIGAILVALAFYIAREKAGLIGTPAEQRRERRYVTTTAVIAAMLAVSAFVAFLILPSMGVIVVMCATLGWVIGRWCASLFKDEM